MLAKLSKNEEILKEYQYSSVKDKKSGLIENTLSVTNKRIVSESTSKNSIVRKEIPLKAAEYITTQLGMSNGSLIAVILCAIVAIALIILGAVEGITAIIIVGAVFIVLAIAALIIFFTKKKTSVTVIISGLFAENNLLSVSSSTIAARTMKSSKIKIKVNREVASDMVNEIGAIILDAKEAVVEKKPKESVFSKIDAE